jgi:hypothetical protein
MPLADAALHAGSVTLEQVHRVLEREASWPFADAASRAVPFVDGRRESVLESRSGIVIQQHGLPAPTPQVKIFDANGRFVARSDFGWPKSDRQMMLGVCRCTDRHGPVVIVGLLRSCDHWRVRARAASIAHRAVVGRVRRCDRV